MKRTLLALALAALAAPAFAGVTCNLFLVGQSCSFATDTPVMRLHSSSDSLFAATAASNPVVYLSMKSRSIQPCATT